MNNNSFWWIALLAWIGGSTWWHTCKIKMLCDTPLTTSEVSAPVTVNPLHIMDGGDLMLTSPGNFSFARSGFEPNLSGVQAEVDSVTNYLLKYPDKRLVLTGYYSSAETNSSTWPNLGIARAESLKAYYVSKGLPADAFVTKGVLDDNLSFDVDSLRGGLDYGFTNQLTLKENAIAESQKFESIFTTLDLYFNTGSVNYIKTNDNEQFINEAKKYLQENPQTKLMLTGHTDNVGNAAANLKLSKDRAEEVRRQLVEFGLPEAQLLVDAKGQTQPKADNKTEDGRANNRRVSILVNK